MNLQCNNVQQLLNLCRLTLHTLHHAHSLDEERLEFTQFDGGKVRHLDMSGHCEKGDFTCRYVPRMTPSLRRPIRILACRTSLKSFNNERNVPGWPRSSGALVLASRPRGTYTSRRTLLVSTNRRGNASNPSAFSLSFLRSNWSFSPSQQQPNS